MVNVKAEGESLNFGLRLGEGGSVGIFNAIISSYGKIPKNW